MHGDIANEASSARFRSEQTAKEFFEARKQAFRAPSFGGGQAASAFLFIERLICPRGGGWCYLACLAKHVTPRFRPYAGECGSPLGFVVTKNLHQRHLTESQRALVAARLKPPFEEVARQRQVAALQRRTEPPVPPNLEERGERQEQGESAERAAALMNVSRSSVWSADRVKKHGVPHLVDALTAGKLSVSAAARNAKLPAEQQEGVLKAIAGGLKPKQALAQVQATLRRQIGWAVRELKI
jgi:hypothetical protein